MKPTSLQWIVPTTARQSSQGECDERRAQTKSWQATFILLVVFVGSICTVTAIRAIRRNNRDERRQTRRSIRITVPLLSPWVKVRRTHNSLPLSMAAMGIALSYET